MKLYGGIEAGGTKFVCAVGNEQLDIIDRIHIPTTTPDETMQQVVMFFQAYQNDLASIAIGSFGPIDIKEHSPTYGYITSTPKLAWQNFNFVGTLKQSFPLPVYWTTDVNASAYGEYIAGSGQGLSNLVYVTIGTGIGGGAIHEGRFIEGHSHPEMGHIITKKHEKDDFKGNCPYHTDCLEGLAAGPAIEKRFGKKGQELATDHWYWDAEAYYIAQCAYSTTLNFSPQKIVFGGGVMKQPQMLKKVHAEFRKLMNDYLPLPDLDAYIVTPALGDDAATIGCLALAQRTANK